MGLENLAVAMENLLAAWNDALEKPEFLRSTDRALHVANKVVSSATRLPNNLVDGYFSTANGWKRTLVTAGAGVPISADGEPVLIGAVRVAGTAALGGACTVASGTVASNTVQETIQAAAAPGVALDYLNGTEFADGCVITVATSGTVIVFWRPMA